MFKPTPDLQRSFNDYYSKLSRWASCHYAIAFKSELEEALSAGFPIDYSPNKEYTSLLTQAIKYISYRSVIFDRANSKEEAEKIVETLLDKGANVNDTDAWGTNKLMVAALNEAMSPELFGKIVTRTKDINHKDHNGHSALDKLFKTYTASLSANNLLELSKYIKDIEDELNNNIVDRCKILIDAGAVLNSRWNEKETQNGLKRNSERERNWKKLYSVLTAYQESKNQLYKDSSTMAFDYEL